MAFPTDPCLPAATPPSTGRHLAWSAPPRPVRLRARLTAALVVLTLVLAACGDPIVPPPPPPEGDAYQRLLGTAAIAGLQLTITYNPANFDFMGFTAVQAGVLARAYDDGVGTLTLGLVATGAAMSGQLLRLNWKGPEDAAVPRILLASAYDGDLGAIDDAVTLGDLRPLEAGLGSPALSSSVPGVDLVGGGSAVAMDAVAAPLALSAGFADYHLGDLDQSGDVDVLDTLMILAVASGTNANPDDFTRYHADLSGDDAFTVLDVEMALAKSVDPTVPAHLVVKPGRLTYLDLVADEPVLVGNGGSLPLTGLAFAGQNFSGSSFAGSAVQPVPGHSAVYRVTADPNDANGVLSVSLGSQGASVAVGNIVFLVAGQSNASGWGAPMLPALQNGSAWPEVRALGNDYVWKPAVEGLDNGLGQLDMISFDTANLVSAGVQLGRLLNGGDEDAGIAATDRYVYLIPAGRGASRLTKREGESACGTGFTECGWRLGPADLAATNRTTLFGSAAYRGLVSAGERAMPAGADPSEHAAEGGPVTGVYWYQGESDSSDTTLRTNFVQYTADVFTAFENHFQTAAGQPVIIYAQLAPYGRDASYPNPESVDDALAEDLRQMDVAERQRRMEAGAYTGSSALSPPSGPGSPRANTHMVVTNDLPRSDRIHVSSEGQMILAERIALAYQEHYMGLEVDGTGPRVTALSRSGNVVTVTFDRDVSQTSNPGVNGYSGYFTAWNGAPNPPGLTASYGTSNQVSVTDVRRHPTNARAVQVTLASNPATVYLRYMRPHENTLTSTYVQDVVRGVDSGLPLPSFGPLLVN